LKKAIALDETLPELHMALANGNTWTNWEWAAAEQSFRRALDLNPSYGEAHAFYSHYLYIVGRRQEGAASIQRALELDPLNDLVQQFYGMTLPWERRFEEGISHAERILRTSPSAPSAWTALTENYHHLGRYDEALAAQRKGLDARGDPAIDEALDRGYAEGGYRGAMFRAGEARMASGQPWPAAALFMRAARPDLALDALERAYEARNPNLPYVTVRMIFDEVRTHPRFVALLEKMQLPTR
jgi:tetratricopeptide (TPR) repeat protein